MHVLHRAEKAGLGAAYLAGFRWALDRGYDVVGEMDADGSHLPEDLPRLLAALAEADLVIGSRWVPGGSVEDWPWHRKALSVGGNLYTRVLLGLPVRDATAGYRLFRRSTLERIDLALGGVPGLRLPGRPRLPHVARRPAGGGGADPSSSSGSAVTPR